MTCRRVLTSVLIASCALLPTTVRAQGQSGSYRMASPWGAGPQGGYPPMYSAPPGGRYGNATYTNPPGGGVPAQPATYGPALPAGIVGQKLLGAGEGPNDFVGASQPAMPLEYADPYTAVPGRGYYGRDGIVTKKIPKEDSWDEEGPIERIISTAFSRSWVRMEYLLWDVTSPAGIRLGAPLATGSDPNNVPILDANLNTVGLARIPTTDRLGLEDNNGIRMTMGIPILNGGDFEVSGFMLNQAGDRTRSGDLPTDPNPPAGFLPRFVATSVFTNGQPGNTLLLYDSSFDVAYKSSIWGLDAKFVLPAETAPPGLQVRPLVGVRYLNINEMMTQRGVYSNVLGTLLTPPLQSLIESSSYNNLYGGMVGGRVEFVHPWFTIGAEPRAVAGLNSYQATVETTNLRTYGDGLKTQQRNTQFAPIFEGTLYGRIHLTDYFSLHAGYNWMYLPNVVRANNIIYYNDNGINAPPGVIVKAKTDDLLLKGLIVGGEFRFK